MSEDSPITAFTTRKCPDKSYDSIPKINGQREYGPELDHDRVRFPERVAQGKMEKSFANSQVRGGTDWQKLGHTFNNPENDRQKKIVHDIGYQLSVIGYRLSVIGYRAIRCHRSGQQSQVSSHKSAVTSQMGGRSSCDAGPVVLSFSKKVDS